ncbi:MAG: hypothetical protein ACRDNR_09550 [Gaiellaceae bacterium]
MDETVAGDGLVRPQEQERQQHLLLSGPDRDHPTVVPHLQRAQDPELHRIIVAPSPSPYQPGLTAGSPREKIPLTPGGLRWPPYQDQPEDLFVQAAPVGFRSIRQPR